MTTKNYPDLIAKLLATAESLAQSGREEAAATYLAKASELQLEHMISDSDLRQSGKGPTDEIIAMTVRGVDKGAAFVKAKRDLVAGLASIFHCKVNMAMDRSIMTLYGYESDVTFVQQLLDSLLIQLHSHMLHDAGQELRRAFHVDRSWKTSYAHGWVNRVVSRLRDFRKAQEFAAGQEMSTAVVLRDRSVAVTEYYNDRFAGKIRAGYKNQSVRDARGAAAGADAGNRADLGGTRIETNRKSLPR